MKKVLSVVAALVLCFAMSMTAFAASPSNVNAVKLPAGTTLTAASADTTAAIQKVAADSAKMKALVGSASAQVVAIFELNGNGGECEVAVTGIAAGDTVKVLHWVGGDMTKDPEVLNATAGNGTVKFTTASCSPFAVVKVASAAGSNSASPKTGETAPIAAVAVMLVSAAGIVMLNRKKLF